VIPQPVLVTGGAGFIGSHLVDLLVSKGVAVRVLDNLDPQVHGSGATSPRWLPRGVEFLHGSVTDRKMVARALAGMRSVVHLAASVGVGQSMYAIASYVENNTQGAAVLLDELVNGGHAISRLVVASSMSIYGEGQYRCRACGPVSPPLRPLAQLQERQWEMRCPSCGAPAEAAPTEETKPLAPTSVYAVTKRDHEELCLCVGRAYGIGTLALRLFNVYGARQALSNPYTGVAAIFMSRLLNGKAPVIFEDGLQSRDFVHVSDVARAFSLALERTDVSDRVMNIGTGRATSVLDMARLLGLALGVDIAPEIVAKFREGDIRHCIADSRLAGKLLGFSPKVSLEEGIPELIRWAKSDTAADRVAEACRELEAKGLVR